MHRLTATFSGEVQGVGFRRATQKKALKLSILGVVQNLSDGSVKAEIEGDISALFALIEALATLFSLTKVEVTFEPSIKKFTDFSIL